MMESDLQMMQKCFRDKTRLVFVQCLVKTMAEGLPMSKTAQTLHGYECVIMEMNRADDYSHK